MGIIIARRLRLIPQPRDIPEHHDRGAKNENFLNHDKSLLLQLISISFVVLAGARTTATSGQ
jgi:hypothetical protein